MRRFSIGRLMLVIAFLAANLGVLRLLLADDSRRGPLHLLLCGLLPLADGVLISLWVHASRYRMAVRCRRPGERGRFAPGFAVCSGIFLVCSASIFLLMPQVLDRYFEVTEPPVDRFLDSLGIVTLGNLTRLRYVILPVFLGVILSGPPLLVSIGLAAVLSRFRLDVSPRTTEEESCAASPS